MENLPNYIGGGLMSDVKPAASPNYVTGYAQVIDEKPVPPGTPNNWRKILTLTYNKVDAARCEIELSKLPLAERNECIKFTKHMKGVEDSVQLSPEELKLVEAKREQEEVDRRVKELREADAKKAEKAVKAKETADREKRIQAAVKNALKAKQSGAEDNGSIQPELSSAKANSKSTGQSTRQ